MAEGKRRAAHNAPYCEQGFDPRSRIQFARGRPLLHFCAEHQYTAKKNGLCPECRKPLECAGLTARPPRKGSKEWPQFVEFVRAGHSHPRGCR